MIEINFISAFTDNYFWIITNNKNNNACVIDPGEAKAVNNYLDKHNLTLSHILITHHHFDHTGGVSELKKKHNAFVYGPSNPDIKDIDEHLTDQNNITIPYIINKDKIINIKILEIPGHTLDHIAYYLDYENPKVFCGDTLFAGGCGRIFEGTPKQMFKSLEKLKSLPDNTKVYCAHEYTLNNLQFANSIIPQDKYINSRLLHAIKLREQNTSTIPTTLHEEKLSNIFLRSNDTEIQKILNTQNKPINTFTKLRELKDVF